MDEAHHSASSSADSAAAQDQETRKQQVEEQKRTLLRAFLDNDALERLNRVALVKPDQARIAEQAILSKIQSGAVQPKIGERAIIDLLAHVTEVRKAPSVSVKWRRDRDFDED